MLSAIFFWHRTYLLAASLRHRPAALTSAALKVDWFWAMAVGMAALNECAEYAVPSGRPANWLVCLRILFTNAMVTNFPDDSAYTGPSEDSDLSLVRGWDFVGSGLVALACWFITTVLRTVSFSLLIFRYLYLFKYEYLIIYIPLEFGGILVWLAGLHLLLIEMIFWIHIYSLS